DGPAKAGRLRAIVAWFGSCPVVDNAHPGRSTTARDLEVDVRCSAVLEYVGHTLADCQTDDRAVFDRWIGGDLDGEIDADALAQHPSGAELIVPRGDRRSR